VQIVEEGFAVPRIESGSLIAHFEAALQRRLGGHVTPLRFAVVESSHSQHFCELGVLRANLSDRQESIFKFAKRRLENKTKFNVVLLVPTGIGAEIGGHAGDATPVVQLFAEVCDLIITHPNVVNASDLNESPTNSLYVEGSVICRLLMGTVGLQPVRSNRQLVVIDAHQDPTFVNGAINAVNAARSTYGIDCKKIIKLDPPVRLHSRYADSGRAVGEIENLEYLYRALEENRNEYDAVALSSVIAVPAEYHQGYFDSDGTMVNPWGGVEAMLTHAISSTFDIPSAHSPMFETQEIANKDPGVVDPRMAAEAVSLTFLQCILKGLHQSPRIVGDRKLRSSASVLNATDISCLIIPDGCIGLPTLAALEQGITVIAVRENRNLMRNDLTLLPWAAGQLHIVENYWEAAGVLCAIKAGITPHSVRRPMKRVEVETRDYRSSAEPFANERSETPSMLAQSPLIGDPAANRAARGI
jgi:hypothetical protein